MQRIASKSLPLSHYSIPQQWIVVYSEAAYQRARQPLDGQRQQEAQPIERQLEALRRKRFDQAKMAQQALQQQADSWIYHRLRFSIYAPQPHYPQPGRHTPDTPYQTEWLIDRVDYLVNEEDLLMDSGGLQGA